MKTNMKKLLTLAILGLVGTGAFAQTFQGSVVVSGSVGFSKTTQSEDNSTFQETGSTTFNLMPSIGYVIVDGLELGATIGYTHTIQEFRVYDGWGLAKHELNTDVYSFMPYLKKHFMLTEKVAFTGSAYAGFSSGKAIFHYQNDTDGEQEVETKGFQAGFVPGITFFATEKIGISANFGSLGYSEVELNPAGNAEETTTSTFDLNFDAGTLAVGFSYYINR